MKRMSGSTASRVALEKGAVLQLGERQFNPAAARVRALLPKAPPEVPPPVTLILPVELADVRQSLTDNLEQQKKDQETLQRIFATMEEDRAHARRLADDVGMMAGQTVEHLEAAQSREKDLVDIVTHVLVAIGEINDRQVKGWTFDVKRGGDKLIESITATALR